MDMDIKYARTERSGSMDAIVGFFTSAWDSIVNFFLSVWNTIVGWF